MKQGEKTKNYILEESDKLFYINGYASTSFSDIVKVTNLSKGNITYHFKNKQMILEGIINKRILEIEANFSEWEKKVTSPIARLHLFCDMIINEQDNLKSFGCPMGTLTAEFSKNEPELYSLTVPMFQSYKKWLTKQFTLLKFTNAEEQSMSLLAKVQGVAMVTHAFKDTAFLITEMQKIKDKIQLML